MNHLKQRKLTREQVFRIIIDILLLNTAVVMGLSIRFFFAVISNTAVYLASDLRNFFWDLVRNYLTQGWVLTIIAILIFYANGFYSYGRAYRSRYKALVVAQAVSLSFLLYGFLSYFLGGELSLPRGALVIAWVLTIFFLVLVRVGARLWIIVAQKEKTKLPPEKREIHHVLLIGGAGYIGSALLPKLLNKGYRVRLLDLFMFGTDPIAHVLGHPNLEIMQADFRQVDKVTEAMQNVDAVIHLGAIVGDPACAFDEDLTIQVNLMATRMIAEVAKGSGVSRFIFASTCSVYGASNESLDERSTLNPVSLYARSKIASEKVLRKLADDNFAPTYLRFGTIYGLSGRTRFDLVVNLLTAKGLLDKQITVYGGNQWRPFVHVDDAALAVLKALDADLRLVKNQVFNVGSDEQNYTIQQIGEMIHKLIPEAELLNMGTDTDIRNYRVNFSKIGNTLNFVPNWTVENGILQVIQAIEDGRVIDYRDPQYSNVKFLTEDYDSRIVRRKSDWARKLVDDISLDFEDELAF